MDTYNKNDILFAKIMIHIAKSDSNFEQIEVQAIGTFIKSKKIKESDFKLVSDSRIEKLIDDISGQYLSAHKNILISLIGLDNNLDVNEGKILGLIDKRLK